MPYAKQMT